jgi:hypothetical protein
MNYKPAQKTRKSTRSSKLFVAALVFGAAFSTITHAMAQTIPSPAAPIEGMHSFGFNANRIAGFPGGRAAEMTGGGSFDLAANFVQAGGGFRCLSNISAGFFTGCLEGQGVRWDTAALLTATQFQCTGADPVKLAITGDKTVVLVADFYRQGDGNIESFTAKMIVSENDLDPVTDGVQNVWIQSIGCATNAIVNFN